MADLDEDATFSSGPAALSTRSSRLDVFAIGRDRKFHHNAWLGSGWTGWLRDTPEGQFI